GHALVRLEAEAAALLGTELATDDPERIALLGRRGPGRSRTAGRHRVAEFAQGHVDVPGPALAPDLDLDAAARRLGADHRRQVAGLVDAHAVDLADHVATLDAGLLRSAV